MRYELGIIVPSSNTGRERETQRMAGSGTSIHSRRIAHTADTEENVIWMWKMLRLVADERRVPGGDRLFREH